MNQSGDLKKQSQFANDQMNVRSFLTTYYGDFAALKLRKNKAKQSQFQNPASQRAAANAPKEVLTTAQDLFNEAGIKRKMLLEAGMNAGVF